MFILIILVLLAGIVMAIRSKNTERSGSYASMAAMHDFQTKEKQKAMETVMEQKADRKMNEQESGKKEENDI